MSGALVLDRRRRQWLLPLLVVLALAAIHEPSERYDFCTYHTAGLLVNDGEPEKAYDRDAIGARHLEGHQVNTWPGPFLYSPLYLLPAAMFATQPLRAAEILNHTLTLLSLGIILHLMLARARSLPLEIVFCLVFLLSHTVAVQFLYQNWSFLLVAFVALGWHLSTTRHRWLAALFWAAAMHLKVFAVLFLVPLIRDRRSEILRVVLLGLLLALITLPFLGLSTWVEYVDSMRGQAALGIEPFYNNVSLQATIARLTTDPVEWFRPEGHVTHPAVLWLFPASLPLFLALIWRLRRDWQLGVAATIPYLLLFNPITWDHTMLLLLLVLPILRPRSAVLLAALLCGGVFYSNVLMQLANEALRNESAGRLLGLFLLYYPLLSVIALGDLVLRRGPRAGAVTSPSG